MNSTLGTLARITGAFTLAASLSGCGALVVAALDNHATRDNRYHTELTTQPQQKTKTLDSQN